MRKTLTFVALLSLCGCQSISPDDAKAERALYDQIRPDHLRRIEADGKTPQDRALRWIRVYDAWDARLKSKGA